jgi:hypothetical protein
VTTAATLKWFSQRRFLNDRVWTMAPWFCCVIFLFARRNFALQDFASVPLLPILFVAYNIASEMSSPPLEVRIAFEAMVDCCVCCFHFHFRRCCCNSELAVLITSHSHVLLINYQQAPYTTPESRAASVELLASSTNETTTAASNTDDAVVGET